MTGGLNNHIAGESQVITQGSKFFLGRIAGRVLAFSRVGENVARIEDVAMRVNRTWRKRKSRQRRAGVKSQPVIIHLECRFTQTPTPRVAIGSDYSLCGTPQFHQFMR